MRCVVKNLPRGMGKEEVRALFSEIGSVTDVRVLSDHVGKERRVAFLGFRTEEESERAIVHFNKSYVKGARITVEAVDQKRKGDRSGERMGKRVSREGASGEEANGRGAEGIEEMKDLIKIIEERRKSVWSNGVELEERTKRGKKEESIEELIRKRTEERRRTWCRIVEDTGKVFVQGLPFTAREEEVEEFFSKYGSVAEVYLPVKTTEDQWGEGGYANKGHVTVTYTFPSDALKPYAGSPLIFQGRLVNISPCRAREGEGEDKKKNRSNRCNSDYNALLFNFSAVIGAFTKKGGSKLSALSENARGLGGKVALMESALVEETKRFVEREGVAVGAEEEAFVSKKALLLKNIPGDVKEGEIRVHFKKYRRIVFPPSRMIAVLEYGSSAEAAEELRKNNYIGIRGSPIYVEYLQVTKERYSKERGGGAWGVIDERDGKGMGESEKEDGEKDKEEKTGVGRKLIVKNLPFQAGRREVEDLVKGVIEGKFSLRLPMKFDGTHRGFCFIELESEGDSDILVEKLWHTHLYGRHLVIEPAKL
jgi:RNA recognition motif-containing protein